MREDRLELSDHSWDDFPGREFACKSDSRSLGLNGAFGEFLVSVQAVGSRGENGNHPAATIGSPRY